MEGKSKERRDAPRIQFAGLVRIRPLDPRFPAEVATTSNVSPHGMYFLTSAGHYQPGMQVRVLRDFHPGVSENAPAVSESAEEIGAIVRVDHLDSGRCGVAIHVFSSSTVSAG